LAGIQVSISYLRCAGAPSSSVGMFSTLKHQQAHLLTLKGEHDKPLDIALATNVQHIHNIWKRYWEREKRYI
jgi:hypothetical protein